MVRAGGLKSKPKMPGTLRNGRSQAVEQRIGPATSSTQTQTHAKATTATSAQMTKASTIVVACVPSAFNESCFDPFESSCPPFLLTPRRGLPSSWNTEYHHIRVTEKKYGVYVRSKETKKLATRRQSKMLCTAYRHGDQSASSSSNRALLNYETPAGIHFFHFFGLHGEGFGSRHLIFVERRLTREMPASIPRCKCLRCARHGGNTPLQHQHRHLLLCSRKTTREKHRRLPSIRVVALVDGCFFTARHTGLVILTALQTLS